MSSDEPIQVLPRYVETPAAPPAAPQVAQPPPAQSFMDTMYDYRITILVVALVIVAVLLLAWWIRGRSSTDDPAAETAPPPTTQPVQPAPPPTTQPAQPASPPTTQPAQPASPPTTQPVQPVTPPATLPPAAPSTAPKLTREELLAKQAKGRAAAIAPVGVTVPMVQDQSLSNLYSAEPERSNTDNIDYTQPEEFIHEDPPAQPVEEYTEQPTSPEYSPEDDYFEQYYPTGEEPVAQEAPADPSGAASTCIQVLGSGATCRNKPKFGPYCGVHAKK